MCRTSTRLRGRSLPRAVRANLEPPTHPQPPARWRNHLGPHAQPDSFFFAPSPLSTFSSSPSFLRIDAIPPLCHHLASFVFCSSGDSPIGLRVSILASGSSGNLTLLESERTPILVDAGLGKRETLARLAAVESNFDHLDAVLITHEHADHCNGLPQVLGLWKCP